MLGSIFGEKQAIVPKVLPKAPKDPYPQKMVTFFESFWKSLSGLVAFVVELSVYLSKLSFCIVLGFVFCWKLMLFEAEIYF